MMVMNLHDYISQERGRQAALAKSIGAHAPDVSRWADGSRPIPDKYGAPIESATSGLVTRKEMFPDTWFIVWPELLNNDNAPTTPSPALIEGKPIDGATVREAKGTRRKLITDIHKSID